MALEEDESTWILELESALTEECTARTIYGICKGKNLPENLRSESWQACLGVSEKANKLQSFTEVFDLPEQSVLREDCQQFVDKLGNEEEDKVSIMSDLESVLTFYCKSHGVKYQRGNGWMEILAPLISLKLSRLELYNCFEAINEQYIPRECHHNGTPFHVFRLLLLYHDPELCAFLDTKKITPDMYAINWFQSLFAAACNLQVVLNMWDTYFQQADPYFVFFLGLVMLVNAKEQVTEMKNEAKEKIVEEIVAMPCHLEDEDVSDFCSLAQYYAVKTPGSFRKEFISLFRWQGDGHPLALLGMSDGESIMNASQALCLPVTAEELVLSVDPALHDVDRADSVRFFLVDCRPADQYNAGHLPTAFHLDCNLMLQELQAFATAVQGLLSGQRQAIESNSVAGGEHLCFLGSGREEEDQYVHMVVASFLQKHVSYVSIVKGGYEAIHHFLGVDVELGLLDHNQKQCLVCEHRSSIGSANSGGAHSSSTSLLSHDGTKSSTRPNRSVLTCNSNSTPDLLGLIGNAVKTKSAEMKERLIEYIVNPTGSNGASRHVSSADKVGKRYRNLAPVFTISEDNDADAAGHVQVAEEDDTPEIVSIHSWLDKPEVIASFGCHEVKENGDTYAGYLLVTESYIYMLRELSQRRDTAQVTVKRPLSSVVKITSKKKHPELITFKYGTSEGEILVISDMDRFLIPEAREATKIVKQQILRLLGNADG